MAQQALKTACIRMPDREACAAELATAMDRSSVPTKSVLLEILGEVGGTKALTTVGAAAKSSDPAASGRRQPCARRVDDHRCRAGSAGSGEDRTGDKYQVRALRGYIRIARQFAMPEQQRIEMCQNALETAHQPAEQNLVLDVLKRYPNLETLKLAAKVTREVPELKDEATQATLAIAQKLGDKADEVRKILSNAELEKVKLEIVKAEYGAGSTQKDVTEALRKQVTDVQLIILPSSGYNDTFGGDPAPGTNKQLKIQYRINGKDGEASFAENALVILPLPK